LKKSMNPS